MSKYKQYGLHTKEWKKHFGFIPKDEDGRSYEIHHIDGDPSNNNIENLCCLSIKEHLGIHIKQEDWVAAFMIAKRMKIKPKEISELARKGTLERINKGTHNFQDPNFKRSLFHNKGWVVATDTRNNETVRVTKEKFDASDWLVGVNSNKKKSSVHNNRGHNKGKRWTQKNKEELKKCIHCSFHGKASHLSRYHNERCKFKNES